MVLLKKLTTTVNGQALSGNVTITDISGNAVASDTLKTARKINGIDFDSSKDIEIDVGPDTISDITDTTVTSPSDGQSLVFNGTKWVNKKLTKSDVGLGNVDNTADVNKVVKSAGKLTTARTITFYGTDATGSVSFDGSQDVSVTLTVAHSTKADQNCDGNVIKETYATKAEAAAAVLTWSNF